jgi:nitrite reductase/ring-hydroxylating ferredoxin subunit
MSSMMNQVDSDQRSWQYLIALTELAPESVKMLRVEGRQIALFHTADGVRACDNRCPHEGYPLSEGSLSADCILTCNWHNWKFNLETGDNLYGGDRLRTYPVEIRDGDIWVDLTEIPYAERYASICDSLRDAFDDYSYDRIARETARLIKIGADPFDVLRLAIDWSWQKLEFGWTHAYAGMADWLTLYHEHRDSRELSLVCLVESVAHVAYDVLRETDYPFGAITAEHTVDKFNETSFVEFIDNEDEASAVAAIRAGIRDGLQFADFESALTRAALLHYNDFGHSLIYVTKVARLIEQLGDTVTEPLLLSLVRGFIYASREDRIPEFRAYATQLARWGKHKSMTADPALWRQRGINKSLQATVACSANPPGQIYHALLLANATSLLSFDINQQDKIKVPVSGNVGWLDFTHGLTFANAVRRQCTRYPELWPQGLLQMACFNGRNAAFTTAQIDVERWCPGDPHQQLRVLLERVLDHGEAEHIVSVHLLKTALSVREEIVSLDESDAKLLVAALTRFFESPLKRRQARRIAHQSLQFVARE